MVDDEDAVVLDEDVVGRDVINELDVADVSEVEEDWAVVLLVCTLLLDITLLVVDTGTEYVAGVTPKTEASTAALTPGELELLMYPYLK